MRNSLKVSFEHLNFMKKPLHTNKYNKTKRASVTLDSNVALDIGQPENIFVYTPLTKMGSLMEDYEQQYAVLTAEITAKVSQLGLQCTSDRKKLILDIEKHMEEAQELLEQMELEVREIEASIRPRYRTRVDSFRAELGRLSHEFMKVRNAGGAGDHSNSPDDFFGEGYSIKDEQKQRLLNNSERIERTNNHLKTGYRIILETEEIGSSILQDLHSQRETIDKSRTRLRETDAELGRSSRILSSMVMRSLQNKFILFGVAVVFVLVIILTIYFSLVH